MRTILLIDNGSRRADSTLNLRRLAARLAERAGEPVLPVSLLHSDQVPADRLDGRPADTLAPTLHRLLTQGARDVVLVPLFFGPSRALTQFVPDTAAALTDAFDPFRLRIASELCPLPDGEPRLAEILAEQVEQAARATGRPVTRVVLVDHGSPVPEVTAVRRWLGERLAQRLGPGVRVEQAVMERRAGADYDFNGPLLEDLLRDLADADRATPVILAMLFLSAGRHAGPGGDIADIIGRVESEYSGFRIHPSPLVGSHPGLIEIFLSRLNALPS
ncbi:CbiX/SirB N-terminal domain-containing protein [uncultured Thiocystis sp.]|jgi:sirohydrochlorin ferrochelatase|uniref:sirohydrochlorin chelatase n=1 Tax=uncultured Thiocystis sp. TaxID=1202134 RepID=UPI0025E6CC7C|nr:CbiX/SirB N-terminal domain-containing protein [uncultured Thiocystis sp.]